MASQFNRINPLAGPYLDRRAEERELDNWLDLARGDHTTRYLVAHRTRQLVAAGDAPAALLLEATAARVDQVVANDAVLLGWFRGIRCVLLHTDSPQAFATLGRFEELRPLVPALDSQEAALLAYARAMSYWRERHRYCGVCGSPTQSAKAGHVIQCTNPACRSDFFPRIDPAIIVLVTDRSGERALLGRQAAWPPGRYSTIAGFVEPGESLEDAVAREVFEETSVEVESVSYESSQPWPFPSSLMLGFQAVAAANAAPRGSGELEDARWFSRAEIASGTPMLPPPASISYRLIETWFDSGSLGALAQQPNVGRWNAPRR